MTDAVGSLDDLITEAAETAPVSDLPPKRGRGRPRKNPLPGFDSGAPASSGVARRVGRAGSKAAIRETINAIVGVGNIAVLAISKEDALDEREMSMLAEAATDEAMSIERVRAWLSMASRVTPHVAMITVAVAIALPRLVRRGIIPASVMDRMGGTPTAGVREDARPIEFDAPETNAETDGASAEYYAEFAVPVEAGRAFGSNGRYGVG